MNINNKKILTFGVLFTLLSGCKLGFSNNNSSSSLDTSSVSSISDISNSSNSVSSSSSIIASGTFIVNGQNVNANDWELDNALISYDDGLNISSIDNQNNNKITLKHISLKKNKTYKLNFAAKGNANLKISLLNKGSEDVIKGMNSSYILKEDKEHYELTFIAEKDYSNVYIIIESNASYNLNSLVLSRYNLTGDYEAPVFYGLDNRGVYITTKFNYKLDVSVVDNVDGDLTSKYEVELPNNVNVEGTTVTFPSVGEYKFIYTCADKEDNVAKVERIIEVYDSMPTGHEFIKNGSFDQGLSYWYHDAYNGAEGSFDVVKEGDNNVLKASITKLPEAGSHQPFPRLPYGKLGSKQMTDELVIEKGCTYTLSFKMKASVARTIQVVVGEVLDEQDANGNWTYYFAQEKETYGWGLNERTITTEWQTFTIQFTMALDYTNLNGLVGFCFGDSSNAQVGDIYMDDVSLIKN